jgi:large subunit ribosomal protein L29
MAKAKELREKSVEELREEMKNLSEKLFKFRMELAAGQLTNPSQIKVARRDLARVKTILREIELKIR